MLSASPTQVPTWRLYTPVPCEKWPWKHDVIALCDVLLKIVIPAVFYKPPCKVHSQTNSFHSNTITAN